MDLTEDGYVVTIGVAEVLESIRAEFGDETPESELMRDEFGLARMVTRLVEVTEADGGKGDVRSRNFYNMDHKRRTNGHCVQREIGLP